MGTDPDLPTAHHRARGVGAVLAVLLLALAGLVACDEPDKAAAPSVIRLGALIGLSGDNAPAGQRMAQAMQLAVNEANDHGGVLGHRVELVTGDDACDAGTAVVKANELVSQNITISVGGGCSVSTVSTLKVFHDAGIPMIIPAANSTDLLTPRYNSIFLLSGTTKIEAQRAVAAMDQLGTHRVALFEDGTSFSQTLAESTVAAVKQPGSKLALTTQMTLSQGADSYPRVVEAAMQQQADTVFFTGYFPEAAKLIRDLRGAGYTGKVLLSDAATDPSLFTALDGAQAEGVYGLTLPQAQFDPQASGWAARYKAAYGNEPGPFTMQSYDAVQLALNAILRAGSLDRAAIRQAVAASVPSDIKLLSGPSKFNPDGTQVDPTFVLLQIHNGAFTLAR